MKNIGLIRCICLSVLFLLAVSCTQQRVVRFGVCTDVHKDIMHDADRRLQVFVDEMKNETIELFLME